MKGKMVYISGPMTGIDDFNYPLFDQVETELQDLGAVVLNPARHPMGLNWDLYMQYAELDVKHSEIVCLLPGWFHSKGSNLEVHWAFKQKKDFFLYTEGHFSKLNITKPKGTL